MKESNLQSLQEDAFETPAFAISPTEVVAGTRFALVKDKPLAYEANFFDYLNTPLVNIVSYIHA